MTGRKAKPAALKVLRMTARRAEKLTKKITPTPGPLLEAPADLTAAQRADWDYVIANAPRGVLRRIDRMVLTGFILAVDVQRRAARAMADSQLLVKSPKQEVPMQNPYLPIFNKQNINILRIASELGFTPCSRARIDAGNPPAQEFGDWEDVEAG